MNINKFINKLYYKELIEPSLAALNIYNPKFKYIFFQPRLMYHQDRVQLLTKQDSKPQMEETHTWVHGTGGATTHKALEVPKLCASSFKPLPRLGCLLPKKFKISPSVLFKKI